MNKEQKTALVEEIAGQIQDSDAVFAVALGLAPVVDAIAAAVLPSGWALMRRPSLVVVFCRR